MTQPPRQGDTAIDSDAAVEDLAHLLARMSGLRRAIAWDAAAGELPDLHRAAAIVSTHQHVDPPGRAAPQEALDVLADWAQTRGIRTAAGLQLRASEQGTRVVADRPIPAGHALVEVPVEAMVRTSTIMTEHPKLGPWLREAPLFGPGTLMLWLVIARHGQGSDADQNPWAAYVAALPGEVPGTALSWPRSPGSHLRAADIGRRFLAGVLQLYCLVYRRLLQTPAAERPLPLEAFTLQRWLWAGAIMSSRQTEIPTPGGGELALVPVWDLIAHSESTRAATNAFEGEHLHCTAGAALDVGEQVTMYYGRRTPTERWVYGGFVPPGPPDGGTPRLPFPLPAEAPLRRNKLVWLISERDRPVEVPLADGQLDEALARARWYALDAEELTRLGISTVVDAWDQPLQLSKAGEARARALLQAWLRARAGPATPEQPFSREHAFILAAAHVHYTRLLQPTEGPRLLDDRDAPALDAFLATQPDAPLLLRTNLHAAGLVFSGIRHSGTWVGVFEGEALVGAAIHARNGYLSVHAKTHAPVLASLALACSGRSLTGLSGCSPQVDAIREQLEHAAGPLARDLRHCIYTLELASLREPAPPPAEALSLRRVDSENWQLELDDRVVSSLTLAPRVGGVVELTNVSTPADLRRRGYARHSLSLALLQAREQGATRAVLHVEASNQAARATYESLGFQAIGEHAILVYESG